MSGRERGAECPNCKRTVAGRGDYAWAHGPFGAHEKRIEGLCYGADDHECIRRTAMRIGPCVCSDPHNERRCSWRGTGLGGHSRTVGETWRNGMMQPERASGR